jgi:hypothetical protein
MQYDIEIIPGTSGTVGHELGLVLNYKITASGKPVDLSGAELVFIASAGGSAVLTKTTPGLLDVMLARVKISISGVILAVLD